uniref:Uncharacterized protein n=1 Tax=Anguilla anguilla TaxID=7936 RepID=A0A0E9U6E6_ANGAN
MALKPSAVPLPPGLYGSPLPLGLVRCEAMQTVKG